MTFSVHLIITCVYNVSDNFKTGTISSVLLPEDLIVFLTASKLNPEESEKDQQTKEETTGGSKLTKNRVYVEELRLPEIMIPLTRPKGTVCKCVFETVNILHFSNFWYFVINTILG